MGCFIWGDDEPDTTDLVGGTATITFAIATCDRPGCQKVTNGHSAVSITDVGAWAFCSLACLLIFMRENFIETPTQRVR